jgi:dipeptidyl aminopeptidase/acylaminoacyl peptidase
VPSTQGGTNLHWGAGRIVFLSYQDGWPHLYSIPDVGGASTLLTPGGFMAEYLSISPDGRWMVFAGNTGPDPLDIDRRHVVKVSVDRARMEVMTPGAGNEWTPIVTGDGNTLAFIGATAQEPPLVTVMPFGGGQRMALTRDRIPADFPTDELVTPKQVVFDAPDGTKIHGQLFERAGGPSTKPAIIYVHGGPPRQMLLGWHYSDYYANAYATNQYLASRGFVVLSVNYRLGIGYGYEFHRPARGAGARGASEYQDVKAGAEWLARQPQVDAAHIGIYGGSYGGYLTGLALGRDSDLFAAGVDIHGVHDWTSRGSGPAGPGRYEQPADVDLARRIAWESSPVSAIDKWKSPVLVIHADDDRNVQFSQSTDLVQRLTAKGVDVESLVIVDDTHHMMRHTNWITIGKATAAFFERRFMRKY